jgi:hypothetical protein
MQAQLPGVNYLGRRARLPNRRRRLGVEHRRQVHGSGL